MPLNFPASPVDGDVYGSYVWNDTVGAWQSRSGALVIMSATAPAAPSAGDLWWNSTIGDLFVYYNDGDSSQWVPASGPKVTVAATAPTGYEGQLWLDDTDGSMYVYYTDPGGGSSSWIGAVSRSGGILQVVSTTKTDTFTTSSTSFTDITGLSASITPSSTSSKIIVIAEIGIADVATANSVNFRLVRGATAIGVGDAAGTRLRSSFRQTLTADRGVSSSMTFLDSPSTSATTTYSVQIATETVAVYVNRTASDADTPARGRTASTITLMEIAG